MKNFFVRWLIAVLLAPGPTFAQAQPSTMQRAVSGLIQQKAIQRGFAANDPRINATLQAGTSTVIGAAAAAAVITAAGVTAPAWITAAVAVGLSTVFAYGVSLAIDAAVSWLFNSDGSVSFVTVPIDTTPHAMVAGGPYWSFNGYKMAGDPWTLMRAIVSAPGAFVSNAHQTYTLRFCKMNGPGDAECRIRMENASHPCTDSDRFCTDPEYMTYVGIYRVGEGAPASCQSGMFYTGGQCVGLDDSAQNQNVGEVSAPKTASDAVASLSVEDKAKPLNPAVLAAIADQIWKGAAQQPNYEGLPYDAAAPITAADAATYQALNTATYPTVGDAVTPQTGGSADPASSPWVLPSPSAGTGTSPGTDTGTGTTPTAPSGPVIDWSISGGGDVIPKQGVAASYTPTLFAAPTGCPGPVSFEMMGKPYTIGYGPFCDLMATLAPIFLALGAAAAALIFAESLKS